MPSPDFTDDELYLINCAKSQIANGSPNSYMWGYLVGASVLAGFGAFQSSTPMLLSAFVLMVVFRIYEERFQSQWLPMWRSIILKFEAAAGDEAADREVM